VEPISRRQTLAGAGLIGVGLPVLAACGGDGGDTGGDTSSADPTEASTSATPTGSDSASATEPSSAAVEGLVAAADVPVGGGVILDDEKLVVTQPESGTFKAFSSTCTHQGCTVTKVADGTINCPCHGSRFSVEDGSVQGGPAPSPLPETGVEVQGGEVVRA
jgi:Rieske Fe-S protein